MIGAICSLSPLLYFKLFPGTLFVLPYIDQTVITEVLIPLGLSFYALQQITGLFDCTRKGVGQLKLNEYLLYSFCFFYLPSGPILPYRSAVTQLANMASVHISLEQFSKGLSLFILGFSKKVLCADPISQWIDAFYNLLEQNPETILSGTEMSYIVWGSTLQFYFEFSAYSDMAIGIGLCFGMLLPINFDSPLKAKSPMEYINSWHMSFMAFVREYVFQPVFMHLKHLPIKAMEFRYTVAWVCAVFATFFVTGAWHAPTPTAIFYSVIFALIAVTIELTTRKINIKHNWLNKLLLPLSRLLLLTGISFTAVCFRTPDGELLQAVMSSCVTNFHFSVSPRFWPTDLFPLFITTDGFFPNYPNELGLQGLAGFLSPGESLLHILIVTAIVFFMPNSMEIFQLHSSKKYSVLSSRWNLSKGHAVALGFLFVCSLMLFSYDSGFIYG